MRRGIKERKKKKKKTGRTPRETSSIMMSKIPRQQWFKVPKKQPVKFKKTKQNIPQWERC